MHRHGLPWQQGHRVPDHHLRTCLLWNGAVAVMARYTDQVFDEYNRPGERAEIYVFTPEGELVDDLTDDGGFDLANPVLTDTDGIFYFNVPDGEYEIEITYSVELKYREIVRIGVTGSGVINTADLAGDAVTFPKMQNIASGTILGRVSGGTGDPEELSGT